MSTLQQQLDQINQQKAEIAKKEAVIKEIMKPTSEICKLLEQLSGTLNEYPDIKFQAGLVIKEKLEEFGFFNGEASSSTSNGNGNGNYAEGSKLTATSNQNVYKNDEGDFLVKFARKQSKGQNRSVNAIDWNNWLTQEGVIIEGKIVKGNDGFFLHIISFSKPDEVILGLDFSLSPAENLAKGLIELPDDDSDDSTDSTSADQEEE